LGIDAGSVRIGVAACDPDGLMAFPVVTVTQGSQAVNELLAIVSEYSASCIYVGSPISLAGNSTASTEMANELANAVLEAGTNLNFEIEVRLVDERLSTVSAQSQLRESGRNAKTSKSVVDQAAAVVILEHALEVESRSGHRAGVKVGD